MSNEALENLTKQFRYAAETLTMEYSEQLQRVPTGSYRPDELALELDDWWSNIPLEE